MITLLLSVFCVTSVLAAPAPREKLHLYLLAGQSNMSGRGVAEQQDRTPDKGDQTHFDSASQREFGKRNAAAMLELQSGAADGVGGGRGEPAGAGRSNR
jgi:hypothetical protein